jgi:hypothetical protein
MKMAEKIEREGKSLTPKGWFSRRHQDGTSHSSAIATFQARKIAKKERAKLDVTKYKTPENQILALDKRLGKGIGAVRERARLAELTKSFATLREAYVELPEDAKKRFKTVD